LDLPRSTITLSRFSFLVYYTATKGKDRILKKDFI